LACSFSEQPPCRDIAFEVGQYPNGRIALAGSYRETNFSDALVRWAGGQPELDPELFEGRTADGTRLRCVGGVTSTN
jgi:hypothetical protein